MKRKIVRPLLVAIGLFFMFANSVPAAVETNAVTTLKPSAKPVATTVSADGRWLFVLTGKGTVDIFEAAGTLKDTIKIEGQADGIASSPTGDRLFLSNKSAGTISVVAVSFVQNIETAGAPFKGPENAPVAVAVFSDFQCPYCAKVSSLMDQVLALYPKEVKVVHKSFPLQSHQLALPAAIAALAANRQGKFWEMHDKIFENMSSLTEEKFTEFAKGLGLDMDKFAADSKDPQLRQQVQLDLQNGVNAEVRGTPTIFVNGRRLNERSLEGMKALIDGELRKAK